MATCTKMECEKDVDSRGLCTQHYAEYYRITHKNKIAAQKQEWYQKNLLENRIARKKYYHTNKILSPKSVVTTEERAARKTQKQQYMREYRQKNRTKLNYQNSAWFKTLSTEDQLKHKLAKNVRNRLNRVLRGKYKGGSAVRDLGCSLGQFKEHLEGQFQPGMSWDNYGRQTNKWSIDHIRPLIKFDLTNREEFLQAVHYTNLQPLWVVDNSRKGAK